MSLGIEIIMYFSQFIEPHTLQYTINLSNTPLLWVVEPCYLCVIPTLKAFGIGFA